MYGYKEYTIYGDDLAGPGLSVVSIIYNLWLYRLV